MPLIVTLDVERDYGPQWRTPSSLTFRSVLETLPGRFTALVSEFGVRPTYLLSGEVLENPECCAALAGLPDCELGTHLHGEYVAPERTPLALDDPRLRIEAMQWEYDAALERAKLGTLTGLFRQQFGRRPVSFRAGRFGIGPHTGQALRQLGYLVDSSVTPHVVWTSRDGSARPDFRAARTQPYWAADDLLTAGDGALLEVPVTILAPGELAGQPLWLRPSYTPVPQLLALLEHVVRREPTRPLVMMFHSMELVAGASPYAQSDADVDACFAALRAVFAKARALGVPSCTLQEYHAQRLHERQSAPAPVWEQRRQVGGWAVGLPADDVNATLQRHAVQPWFAYMFASRAERWDVCLAGAWIAEHCQPDDPILSTGCGTGFNLMWLAQRGFHALYGCDVDRNAIAAGCELAERHGLPLRLWVEDATMPNGVPHVPFAVITALNWLPLLEGFSLEAFLDRYVPMLRADGALIFDYIDAAYDAVPDNEYLTSDWSKPVTERRPSEYRTRFSRAQIEAALAAHGLQIDTVFAEPQVIPKGVVVARRSRVEPLVTLPRRRPRVLLIVDAPGWAHERKADNLARVLAPRFDVVKRFQADVRGADCAAAERILVFYWRQFQAMPHRTEVLAAGRGKFLLGICSHNELEGRLRAPGLQVLQRLASGIFVHSQLLHDEFAALFDVPVWLLPNGVDTTFFTPGAERPSTGPLRVGWAGSLENFGAEMRGYSNYIVPAIAAVDGVELVTAAREDRLRTAAEMRDFYRALDLYICASRREGTPNPCLEAAACGVPLLTTRVGNMPELIGDGRNGLFIERDVADIAAKLRHLRDDRPALRAMRAAILASIRAWDWQERGRGYAEMLAAPLAAGVTV